MGMVRISPPNISPIINGDMFSIIMWLSVLFSAGLAAFFIANYASKRFGTDKKKTDVCFIVISVCMTLLLLSFFGCAATTVKGCILCFVLVLSSFEDIKTRECDDFLHLMIVIAAFIGTSAISIIGMYFAGIIVFALMLGTVLFTKGEIGGADIKFSAACAFLLGIRKGIIGLMIGLILAVIVNLIKNRKNKDKGFPMIPYLAVGFMTAYFI